MSNFHSGYSDSFQTIRAELARVPSEISDAVNRKEKLDDRDTQAIRALLLESLDVTDSHTGKVESVYLANPDAYIQDVARLRQCYENLVVSGTTDFAEFFRVRSAYIAVVFVARFVMEVL